MRTKTAELWAKQDQHEGDRWRLFSAVAEAIDAKTVFYPGCYVDIAPSFVFDSVTYLDADKRTPTFFADGDGRHLRIGGALLVNSSHGDVAMASMDPLCELSGRGISYTKSPFAYVFTRVS